MEQLNNERELTREERLEIEEIRIYQIGATIEVHMGMHAIQCTA